MKSEELVFNSKNESQFNNGLIFQKFCRIETSRRKEKNSLEHSIDKNISDIFSLKMSESFIEETQENGKQPEKTVIISDTNSDLSLLNEEQIPKNIIINNCNLKKPSNIFDVVLDMKVINEDNHLETHKKINSISKVSMKKNVKKSMLILKSDNDFRKESKKNKYEYNDETADNIILSEKKKKEILHWLSSNLKTSLKDESSSFESIVSDSIRSSYSSGNSSLERFEQNFETPNNREKFDKIHNDEKKITKTLVKSNSTSLSKKKNSEIKNHSSYNSYSKITSNDILKERNNHIEISILNNRSPETKKLCNNQSKTNDLFKEESPVKIENIDCMNSKSNFHTKSQYVLINNPDISVVGLDSDLNNYFDEYNNLNVKKQLFNGLISCKMLKNGENTILQKLPKKKSEDTINDCADILENLYGSDWKNKASTLVTVPSAKSKISHQEPIEETVSKKLEFVVQKPSQQENKLIETNTTIQVQLDPNIQNTSILTTTNSSPDCSYYTALSNPFASLQKDQFNKDILSKKNIYITSKNLKEKSKNFKFKNWNLREKKKFFDSSSSSVTSEFDPEDVVTPKKNSTNLNIQKFSNINSVKDKIIKNFELKKNFLASLSKDVSLDKADFKAMVYRVKYDTLKEELCKVLYKLFNDKVFDNQLPDDLTIEWNSRLLKTAGKCYNRQSTKTFGKIIRSSRIVLSSKILDSPDRLRDTLIHEMCHAATWIINSTSDGHGNFWKAWAWRAKNVFPDLPTISRCHNYKIQTKYTYKCIKCGYYIGRHSKSLDLSKKRCGYCHGIFQLLSNKISRAGKVIEKKNIKTKELSGFALFVKQNYILVQQSVPSAKHGEIMKILGQQFSNLKIALN